MPPVANPVPLTALASGLTGICAPRRAQSRFVNEIKEYYGVEHVYLTSSGKAALTLILKALKTLRPGRRRVVIPAYTCYSVPSSIVKAGLEPAPCDIDPVTLDFDKELLGRAIDSDTLCVVPNHLFGMAADVEYARGLAREAGAFVVEDAAQAMGVASGGKKLGTIGDAGFMSLGRGKNITAGSGGIIITGSPEIARALDELYSLIEAPGAIKMCKEFLGVIMMKLFSRPSLFWFPAGLPFLRLGETIYHKDFPVRRLSGFQAGLMKGWVKRLESINRGRTETAAFFASGLDKGPVGDTATPYLRLPLLTDGPAERDRLYEESQRRGLGISLMYPEAVNNIEEIRAMFAGKSYPKAEGVAKRLVALPTHYLLGRADRENVLKLCQKALNRTEPAVAGEFNGGASEACHNN